MTIAGRFAAAVVDLAGDRPQVPELLPARLAGAGARVLAVDGAGLSVTDGEGRRIPLGSSSETAAVAERLQFTAGDGPCAAAQARQEPVFAALDDLHRRWPVFARLLVATTPFRAVVALPLGDALAGRGALDLFFADEAAVPGLDVFEAMAVGGLISSALGEAAVWSEWAPQDGPAWLRTPTAVRRAQVWTAIGRICLARDVDAPAALDLLRAAAWSADRTVDDLAAEVLAGRLDAVGLGIADGDGP